MHKVIKYSESVQLMMDNVQKFVADCCELSGEYEIDSTTLWHAWSLWCKANDCWPASRRFVGMSMSRAGFKRHKTTGKTLYLGLRLKPEEGDSNATTYAQKL